MEPVRFADGGLVLVDQRALPRQELYVRSDTVQEAAEAIRAMVVRGAPAIGLAAAYAVVLAARAARTAEDPVAELDRLLGMLGGARPTAVNLRAEVERSRAVLPPDPAQWEAAALAQAQRRHREQVLEDEAMAENALDLFRPGMRVLTHCNTGALATGGRGTAFAAIALAHERLGLAEVLVDETRPLLQGARLTAFELSELRVPHRIVVDGAAGHLMCSGLVDLVIVGADRIGADGRVANKIGTYGLAVLSHHHGIPFAVVAPRSTCDPTWYGDREIEIEQRPEGEVLSFWGTRHTPERSSARNPAFDVTPGELVQAIVREDALYRPPYRLS